MRTSFYVQDPDARTPKWARVTHWTNRVYLGTRRVDRKCSSEPHSHRSGCRPTENLDVLFVRNALPTYFHWLLHLTTFAGFVALIYSKSKSTLICWLTLFAEKCNHKYILGCTELGGLHSALVLVSLTSLHITNKCNNVSSYNFKQSWIRADSNKRPLFDS